MASTETTNWFQSFHGQRSQGHRRPLPRAACSAQPPPLRWFPPIPQLTRRQLTEALDKDDRLFDREEALRHDAIMDFQWFSSVGAPRTFSPQQDSGLPCSKRNTPSCEPQCTTAPLLPRLRASMEGATFQQLASSWIDQPRMLPMPIVPASWKLDWTPLWSEDWLALFGLC